ASEKVTADFLEKGLSAVWLSGDYGDAADRTDRRDHAAAGACRYARFSILLEVDGKALSGSEPQQQQAPIVFSPAVPHHFYRHITADTYRDIVQGKTNLLVEIRAPYRGLRGDEHCYLTFELLRLRVVGFFLCLNIVAPPRSHSPL